MVSLRRKADSERLLGGKGLFGKKKSKRLSSSDSLTGTQQNRSIFRLSPTKDLRRDVEYEALSSPEPLSTPPLSPLSPDSSSSSSPFVGYRRRGAEFDPTMQVESTSSSSSNPATLTEQAEETEEQQSYATTEDESGVVQLLPRPATREDPPGTLALGEESSPVHRMLESSRDPPSKKAEDDDTIVTRVLGIVDLSCLNPMQHQQQPDAPSTPDDSIKKTLSFSPVWGTAPTLTMEEAPNTWGAGTNAVDERIITRGLSLADSDSSSVATGKNDFETVEGETEAETDALEIPANNDDVELVLDKNKLERDYSFPTTSPPRENWMRKLVKKAKKRKQKKKKSESKLGIEERSAEEETRSGIDFPKLPIFNMQKPKKTMKTEEIKETKEEEELPLCDIEEEKKDDEEIADTVEDVDNTEHVQDEEDEEELGPKDEPKTKTSKETRYKNILRTLGRRKAPLDPVSEEDSDVSDSEGKIRVPGVQAEDAYISDRDLIGEECEDANEDEIKLKRSVKNVHKKREKLPEVAATATSTEPKEKSQKSIPEPVVQPMNETDESNFAVINKNRSWMEKLGILRNDSNSDSKQSDQSVVGPESLKRQISSNGLFNIGFHLVQKPAEKSKQKSKNEKSKEKPSDEQNVSTTKEKKPQWKAAVDPNSGRTYYYHRLTRQTTWTRPPEDELYGPPTAETELKKSLSKSTDKSDEPERLQRTKSHGDTPSQQDRKKEEIAALLHAMSPPDNTSVDRLMAQYDGREDDLLEQLRDLSESRPFDEPLPTKKDDEDSTQIHDIKSDLKIMATNGASTNKPPTAKSNLQIFTPKVSSRTSQTSLSSNSPSRGKTGNDNMLDDRTRTATSLTSGFSGATRVSELTEIIKNTAASKPHRSTSESDSHTSISSKHGDLLTSPALPHNEQSSPARRIPSNIPVPRSRELMVEEFSSDRVRRESYDPKRLLPPTRKQNTQPARTKTPPLTENLQKKSMYMMDDEDTKTDRDADTIFGLNDSVSALSEPDIDIESKEVTIETARRRALDEAIAREDWDLAAAISDGMRKLKEKKKSQKNVPVEWTQSELDRFISDNDWDAVASYIAHVRGSSSPNRALSPEDIPPIGRIKSQQPQIQRPPSLYPSDSSSSNPKKRFGARSQLQHQSLTSISSWDSDETSEFSDEYTSASYYSEDDRGSSRVK